MNFSALRNACIFPADLNMLHHSKGKSWKMLKFVSAEPVDEPELAQDGGRILRASQALLPQRLRR